jgi:hypothetical protein
VFGDHYLIAVEIRTKQIKEEPIFKRDWKNNSPDRLHQKLSQIDCNIVLESLQEFLYNITLSRNTAGPLTILFEKIYQQRRISEK